MEDRQNSDYQTKGVMEGKNESVLSESIVFSLLELMVDAIAKWLKRTAFCPRSSEVEKMTPENSDQVTSAYI